MTKNPILNALAAAAYIALVVFLITLVTGTSPKTDGESYIIPMMIISLFTLSAGSMSYIFGYKPVMLFLEGQKKAAVNLFVKTLGIFAGLTLLMFALYFTMTIG